MRMPPVTSGTGGSAHSAKSTIFSAIGSVLGGPLGGIAGNVIGGLFGRSGQRAANEANIALAREQMAFQREMASTQYQRAAKDLEAAGLNRILALGSPAAAPQGAKPTIINEEAALADAVGKGVNSALAAVRLRQDIEQSKANIRLTDQQASKTKAEANLVQSQDAQVQAQTAVALQQRINMTLQAAGIRTENQIKELNRQIRSLEIPEVESAAQFYRWLLTSDYALRDYYLQKVYGSSSLGAVQKWFQQLKGEGAIPEQVEQLDMGVAP